ncbi:MAG TPA: glycosyltransferase [Gaiellaceae bacterium]|nr:glycosyltransferase [Gaiellaceae bacterium]
MTGALELAAFAVFVYFALYNLCTFALLALSFGEMSWLVRGRQPGRSGLRPLAHRPGVSVLVPAYDEEDVVVASASALLAQEYEPLEVVVVDDGSRDRTFERLERAFDLVPLPLGGGFPLPSERVRALYASRVEPRLRVVRKDNGGRADALNAGLGIVRHDLVAVTDADGILEPDAIARALRPFEEHPDDCVAAAGNVRVVNASEIAEGRVVAPRVSPSGLEATQVLEYLRGFLGVRIAWSRVNGLAIVSGAFGLFRRDTLVAVGGFLRGSLSEDLESTVRLHRELRPRWPSARVAFAPDAVCWTQAPDTFAGLRSQRVRWQAGLLETLRLHAGMLGRRRYGAVGTVALPYALLFEALSAVIEVTGYAVVIALVVLEPSRWPFLVAFLVVSLLFGQVQSLLALLIEETGFRRYGRAGMARLVGWSLVEMLWFRPLVTLWRAWATLALLVGRRPGWGTVPRRALGESPGEGVVPLLR